MEQKRAWIYCRIAHDGPNSTEVLAAQRHSLDAYAKEHSLEIVGFSKDIGSGRTMDHPGLRDFHVTVENREVDILLIHSLTRLGRDSDKLIKYWNWLRDLGVSIHTQCQHEASESFRLCYEGLVKGEKSIEDLQTARDIANRARTNLDKLVGDKVVYEKQYQAFRKLLRVSNKEVPLSEIMDCVDKIRVDTGKHIVIQWN